MFDVGMFVVCIDGSLYSEEPPPHVTKGNIYQIRALHLDYDGGLILYFHGVEGEVGGSIETKNFIWSTGFNAIHFRPVKTTDIRIFDQFKAPRVLEEVT